ncbi:MAG: hypothetical protein QOF61_977 [Acidobacteriota bacterium]|nr:hypothetical protein [Acidobacteriota bacterium]
MRRFLALTLALLFLVAATCAAGTFAQTASPTQSAHMQQPQPNTTLMTTTQMPAANQSDVDSIDHILAALYDVISGPAGKKRDWDRFRSLFVPGARLIPTSPHRPPGTAPDAPLNGKEEYATHVLTPEDFIERTTPVFAGEGFFERESARRTEQFGHIAHVFSTYESRHRAEDAKPFQRGINSIQLLNDSKRWWVVTIYWEGETERTSLPRKYLKGERQ